MTYNNFDDIGQDTNFPSTIKTFLEHYKILINKYEDLLVKNTEINTLTRDKLINIPTQSSLIESTKNLIQENEAKHNIIVQDLKDLIAKLIHKFNLTLIWLTAGYIIGGSAIVYVKFVIDAIPKKDTMVLNQQISEETKIIHKIITEELRKTAVEYIDATGNKIILFPVQQQSGLNKDNLKGIQK